MMSEATGSRHISSVLHERMCPQGATRGQKHKILEDEKKRIKKTPMQQWNQTTCNYLRVLCFIGMSGTHFNHSIHPRQVGPLGFLHPACGSLSYQMWEPTTSWHTAKQTCTTQKGKLLYYLFMMLSVVLSPYKGKQIWPILSEKLFLASCHNEMIFTCQYMTTNNNETQFS